MSLDEIGAIGNLFTVTSLAIVCGFSFVTFLLFVFCVLDDAFELFDEDDEESLDDDELLELLDREDCVLPDGSEIFFLPSMSSSSDLIQPLMSVLMSKSLLDASSGSRLVSILNFFLILNFN
jgi:hypothetical protein